MTQENKKRSPKTRCVMYTQQLRLLPNNESTKETIKRIVAVTNPKRYAAIIHDKDISEDGQPATPHLHMFLEFENPRSLRHIAQLIQDKPERLEKYDSVRNGFSYLVHRTEGAKDKYKYPFSDVTANFDYQAYVEKITQSVQKHDTFNEKKLFDSLLNGLYDNTITIEEVENILTGSQYAKLGKRIQTVYKKSQERIAKSFEEEMIRSEEPKNIIWIYGGSGNGKTRLARALASAEDENYFISGSGRDPFQQYRNESVVIIDELRPGIFEYSDLLKILDPYNFNAMVPSRYCDKALTARTIYITSPYSPRRFYDNCPIDDKGTDSFTQLQRRIKTCISVDHVSITEMVYLHNHYKADETTRKPNPFASSKLETEPTQSLFPHISELIDDYTTTHELSLPTLPEPEKEPSPIKRIKSEAAIVFGQLKDIDKADSHEEAELLIELNIYYSRFDKYIKRMKEENEEIAPGVTLVTSLRGVFDPRAYGLECIDKIRTYQKQLKDLYAREHPIHFPEDPLFANLPTQKAVTSNDQEKSNDPN